MSDAAVEHYRTIHSAIRGDLPGASVPWLSDARDEALAQFTSVGFPTPRDEAWKYTRVAPIEKRAFVAAVDAMDHGDTVDALGIENLDAYRLIFVNGRLVPGLGDVKNLPAGARVQGLRDALAHPPQGLETLVSDLLKKKSHGFTALNAAFMADGAYIELAPGTVVERPIELFFVSAGDDGEFVSHPSIFVNAGAASAATMIEHYANNDGSRYFNNVQTNVSLASGACLTHYKLQQESTKAFHIAGLNVEQAKDSEFTSHSISIGGALVRNDINSSFNDVGGRCTLNGLYVVDGRQHVDYHTRIDHLKPQCTSVEDYKGILSGHSRGVFNGQVHVHPDAQKSDASQSNHNLLLSRDAEIDTKPQLEIYADDVKCAHGATVGQLDDNMLFYLRARGIDEERARGLLTYGFAQDVVDRIGIEALRMRAAESLLGHIPHADDIREMIQ